MSGPLLADRVKETSTTTGTGTLDLAGTSTGFRTFVAGIGTGNTCFYCISHRTADEWEVGIGTVTDAGTDTLSRTTVLASSNSGSLVNFSAGTKDVFNCDPASNRPSDCVLLDTKVASSSATIDFLLTGNNAGFAQYKLVYANVAPATDGVHLYLRTSSNGGSSYDSGASDYRWGLFTVTSPNAGTAADGAGTGSATAFIRLSYSTAGNASNETCAGEITCFKPDSAAYTKFTWLANTHATGDFDDIVFGGGNRQSAADVDAIRFLFSSGNIASGTFYLYGMRANSQVYNTTNATAASQAEMEAASSLTTYVSPGREKYHPGVAKAWVNFNGTGTPAITASYNVASITDRGAGLYTINFTTSFSSTAYVATGSAMKSVDATDNGNTYVQFGGANTTTVQKTAGSCQMATGYSSSTLQDSVDIYAAFFGDQ